MLYSLINSLVNKHWKGLLIKVFWLTKYSTPILHCTYLIYSIFQNIYILFQGFHHFLSQYPAVFENVWTVIVTVYSAVLENSKHHGTEQSQECSYPVCIHDPNELLASQTQKLKEKSLSAVKCLFILWLDMVSNRWLMLWPNWENTASLTIPYMYIQF